jgi:hypothetical protein
MSKIQVLIAGLETLREIQADRDADAWDQSKYRSR